MPQRQHETCTVAGCTKKHKARGYCEGHYQLFLRGVPVDRPLATRDTTVFEHCTEPDCQNPVKSKGLCAMHYTRKLRHGHTRFPDRKKPPKPCSIEGCERHLYAKGLCHLHYMRTRTAKRHGSTTEQFAEMLKEQDGKCAICRSPEAKLDSRSGVVTNLCMHAYPVDAHRS